MMKLIEYAFKKDRNRKKLQYVESRLKDIKHDLNAIKYGWSECNDNEV